MRLHRLELTGVGPFRDTQIIDFDALTESGLFLIEGPTGSGKTTIIDSIVYALFGTVSGGSTSDPGRIRSSFCAEADPTGVTLDFSVDGRRHRIHRVPAKARDPLEPDTRARSKPTRHTLRELMSDGSEGTVLTRQDEIAAHVEALLGMSSEQFRHLVVLPQGQFAELLRKTPMERMNALAPLLGADYFARVQEQLRVSGDAAAALRREADVAVQRAAQQLTGRLSGLLADDDTELEFVSEDATDAARLASVTGVLHGLDEQATQATSERDALAATLEATRQLATSAADIARVLRDAAQTTADLRATESALGADGPDLDPDTLAVRISELTRSQGSLDDLVAWEDDEATRAAERAALTEALEQSRATAKQLRTSSATLPDERAALEERRSSLRLLSAALTTARREETRLVELTDKMAALTVLLPVLDAAAAGLAAAQEDERGAEQHAQEALDRWQELTVHQARQQAASLALQLEPDVACPVCGSPHHPKPAHPDDGTLISDHDIEATATAATDARERAAASREATAQARDHWHATQTQVVELRGAIGTATAEAIELGLVEARRFRDEAETAETDLAVVTELLAEIDQRVNSLETAISEAEAEAAVAQGRLEALVLEHERQAQALRSSIGEAPSARALLMQTQERLAALDALQRAHSAHALALAAIPAGQRDMTLEAAQAQASSSELALREHEAGLRIMSERVTTLRDAIRDATPLAAHLTDAIRSRANVVAETADAIALGALVNASTAANTKRLQLRSYALQRRFESVLVAASGHLERMSAGQFRFELDDQAAGSGQSGLGITVLDTWTGHLQDPKSLSGGESFYASLALALGLADIVRSEAGGSALETLFVDEGFGSLDQDTLSLVLDQLERLRSGGRAVGVVSHVTEMKESIPDRLEVRRTADHTSHVSVPGAAPW